MSKKVAARPLVLTKDNIIPFIRKIERIFRANDVTNFPRITGKRMCVWMNTNHPQKRKWKVGDKYGWILTVDGFQYFRPK